MAEEDLEEYRRHQAAQAEREAAVRDQHASSQASAHEGQSCARH